MSPIDLEVPWHAIDTERGAKFVLELEREICSRHVLNGKRVRAIAIRQDSDDVLFEFVSPDCGCAVVHLTYARKRKDDPRFPLTEVFASLDEFHARRMKPANKRPVPYGRQLASLVLYIVTVLAATSSLAWFVLAGGMGIFPDFLLRVGLLFVIVVLGFGVVWHFNSDRE
jgi:hypothetical protein